MVSKVVYFVTPKEAGKFFGTQIDYLLNNEEIGCLARLLYEKRKKDWLAGRLATKIFIMSYLSEKYNINCTTKDIHIYNGESGEPYWEFKETKSEELENNLCISISHTNGYAVATGEDSTSVGIDIEPVRNISPAFLRYFLNIDEVNSVKRHFQNINEGATLYWTLKEAASKSLRTGLRIPLKSIKINLPDKDNQKLFNIKVEQNKGRELDLYGTYITFDKFLISVVSNQQNPDLNLKVKIV